MQFARTSRLSGPIEAQRLSSSSRLFFSNIVFAFFSLVILALNICVLLGCKTPSDSKYYLYSVNGYNITHTIGKTCTSCNFTNIPDKYLFGISGTCRSKNGTTHCQHAFPNTFNITAAAFADIAPKNTTDFSLNYIPTKSINHSLVNHLSITVCAILIASVILNFFFIFAVFAGNPADLKSIGKRSLYWTILIDACALIAVCIMVYLIFREEIAGPRKIVNVVGNKAWLKNSGLGVWLMVGAAASRPFNFVLLGVYRYVKTSESTSQLRDARHVDKEFYVDLIAKLANFIAVLRVAVSNYHHPGLIQDSCRRLFEKVPNNEELAAIIAAHLTQRSATMFLNTPNLDIRNTPGPLLLEDCPVKHKEMEQTSRNRGVYLVVLRDCSHDIGFQTNGKEYKYVGSGAGGLGVWGRVQQHRDPEYRNRKNIHTSKFENPMQLYQVWDHLERPCASIYLLAEWDPLPDHTDFQSDESYSHILLAEAIWQVALQVSSPSKISDFTAFLRSYVPNDVDLISRVWEGCNNKSALEKGN